MYAWRTGSFRVNIVTVIERDTIAKLPMQDCVKLYFSVMHVLTLKTVHTDYFINTIQLHTINKQIKFILRHIGLVFIHWT